LKPGHLGKVLHRKWKAVIGAIGWRVRARLGDERLDAGIFRLGVTFRPRLENTCFFGIAGSVGKTTTKDLLVSILKVRGKTIGNPQSLNAAPEVAKTILRTRPWHRYCVAELGETAPGSLDNQLAVLQPSIGIITVVGDDHLSAFGSRQAVAREFAKLVKAVPAHGTVALNVDDELVSSLREDARGQVITYGTGASADLRATDIASIWPDSLQFTANFNGKSVPIRTQLFGKQLLTSALAAIAGGLAAGLTLEECATGIGRVVPVEGRMQPLQVPGGINFIRDDFKAPLWTLDASFEFMSAAQAKRKIIVIGSLSDCGGDAPKKYARVAKRAQEIAELTIFVGPWASQVLKARKPGAEDALRMFRNVRDAVEHINSITREGDLVLLVSIGIQDHLFRILLARNGEIACWRDDCERPIFCNECTHRDKSSGLPLLMADASTPDPLAASIAPTIEPDEQVIIGLGNPESRYVGTPHNVGFSVVEKLAEESGMLWEPSHEASIARGSPHGFPICLVKINMPMNLIGAGLKRLAERLAFGPDQCILVFDDLDMPLGAVRTRLSGGAAGHRGVTSILEAFQTDAFRRVKVGVGQDGTKLDRIAYVLTPFSAASSAVLEQAFPLAEQHVRELVKRQSTAK